MAGLEPDQQPFVPAAIDDVYKASRGVPRVINLICDRALQRGFDQQVSLIGPELIARAVIELDLGSLVPASPEIVTETPESSELPQELDLEALTDVEPPPPELLAGEDDEFEPDADADEQSGRTDTPEPFLGVGSGGPDGRCGSRP